MWFIFCLHLLETKSTIPRNKTGMKLFWIVLLAVLSCAMAEIYEIPLEEVEPPVVKMLREGTWDAYRKKMNHWRSKLVNPQNTYSNDIYSYFDIGYVSKITVGTPDQTFRVVLDTSSADIWVVDHTCASTPLVCDDSICDQGAICEIFCPENVCCEKRLHKKRNPCRGKANFESKRSSTYQQMEGKWSFTYRSGASAEGIFGNDTVRFGEVGKKQLIVPKVKFGQALKLNDDFLDRPHDGFVGLAFSSLSFNGFVQPFEIAHQQGLVQPVFTIYMERVGGRVQNAFGGVVTFGGLDTKHCGDVIAYQPLSAPLYWKFNINNVTANGVELMGYMLDAISDSSATFITSYPSNIEILAKALKAKPSEDALYYIDCKADASISIGIGNQVYQIDGKNLIINVADNVCIVAIRETRNFWGTTWVFGTSFIRQYCHIYDMGNKQIGFARSLKN
ncbi:hypothetical protein RB195_016245 [Necator americanus]|uniref:Peptidase A1 domain-containing protein n=1 Tax=Necator americanus TaxID=51031 RepID=A0ABR1E8U5_NECAM